MLKPFESKARQWIDHHQAASNEICKKSFADTPNSQSNLDRFIRAAASANPPIVLPSFAQESYDRACSEHLLEDEGGAASYDLDPKLGPSSQVPLGRNKLIPLPPGFINSDSQFERQDPQTVHTKFDQIDHIFMLIGGNLYQLREVIDYWLPNDEPEKLDSARLRWLPSLLLEQARLRTIHELNSIQISFTENLQAMNHAICDLREGAFGGRLNTKSVASAKEMFDKLRDLRRLVLRVERPAGDRVRSLRAIETWLKEKCLPALLEIKEPYSPERFDPTDPAQSSLGSLFHEHQVGLTSTVHFLGGKFCQLAGIFQTINAICKTIVEGLHKLMLDVHLGQTTGEFIASWASRWECVCFGLLVKVLGLPALNLGLQRDFPGTEVEFVYLR